MNKSPVTLPPHNTIAARRMLGETRVTLDGKPARITGFLSSFAQIQSDDSSVEFAWQSVAHVVATGGEFFSDPAKARKARKAKHNPKRTRLIEAIQQKVEGADSATLAKIAELLGIEVQDAAA